MIPLGKPEKTLIQFHFLITKEINAEIVSLDFRWILLQTGKQEVNNLWDKLSG